MAKCDVCGNFDESYRQEMGYPKIRIIAFKTINQIVIITGTHH